MYDYVKKVHTKGFRTLALGYSDGYSFLPLDFALCCAREAKNILCDAVKQINSRTSGGKRRAEAHLSTVHDGCIVYIGSAEHVQQRYAPKQDIDLGDAIIMPGLVNAHTHASMTYTRGIADDLPLMQWLTEHVFPLDRQLTADSILAEDKNAESVLTIFMEADYDWQENPS